MVETPLNANDALRDTSRAEHHGHHVPRVMLASRSPRRRSLLTEFGLAHDAEHPGFDDAVLSPGEVGPRQWVASLAYLKASTKATAMEDANDRSHGGHVVLGADTICVKAGMMIGTPSDADEARAILRELSDGQHEVLTGVALIELHHTRPRRRHLFVDSARVRVGMLSDVLIEEYVETGAWQGKAGGYNLAERLESGWPLEYDGDPTTIMGLPMQELVPRLRRMGIVGAFATDAADDVSRS